jgi:hypothetical protein
MISAQTRSAFVARENRCTPIGSSPEGMLFRIMLKRRCRFQSSAVAMHAVAELAMRDNCSAR